MRMTSNSRYRRIRRRTCLDTCLAGNSTVAAVRQELPTIIVSNTHNRTTGLIHNGRCGSVRKEVTCPSGGPVITRLPPGVGSLGSFSARPSGIIDSTLNHRAHNRRTHALSFFSHPWSKGDSDQQSFRRDEAADNLPPRFFLVFDEHSMPS